MSRAATTQLYSLVIVAVVLGLVITRRMRPQPVQPNRLIVGGVIITVVILVSLVGTGGRIVSDPAALALIPVFAAAGIGLGYYLVRTMTFWTDQSSGMLWMKGGALFALILVATILVRFGVRAAATGSLFGGSGGGAGAAQHGLLYDLSADLLFLSLGLWLARAYFIYQRHRTYLGAAS
jgi:hypothetical protein